MKITLPVEIGKKYMRRDGSSALVQDVDQTGLASFDRGAWVWADSGRVLKAYSHDADLVADFVEPDVEQPKGHVHAVNMRLYSEDAAETDKPWERWEWRRHSSEWKETSGGNPTWSAHLQYRRKRKTIRIGEFDVPEPLRVAPANGTRVYIVHMLTKNGLSSCTWGAINPWSDKVLKAALMNGLLHLNEGDAEIHFKAICSVTRAKP